MGISRILRLIVWVLLILNSGSVLHLILDAEVMLPVSCLIISAIALLTNGIRQVELWRIAISFLGVSVFSAVYAIKYGDANLFMNLNDLKLLACLILVILSAAVMGQNRKLIVDDLSSVLKVVVIHGLFCAIVLSVFPTERVVFAPDKDVTVKYVGYFFWLFHRTHVNYWGDLNPTIFELGPFALRRAHGILWEPGNYAVYSNILLFLSLFQTKNKNGIILGLAGVVASYSTSGIVVALVQGFSYFLLHRKFLSRRALTGLVLFSLPMLVVGTFVIENIKAKFGDETSSGSARVASTVTHLRVWVDAPVLGTGHYFPKYRAAIEEQTSAAGELLEQMELNSHEETSFANSTLLVLLQYGLFSSIFFVGLFRTRLVERPFLFGVLILLSCSSAPILNTMIFYYMSYDGLIRR